MYIDSQLQFSDSQTVTAAAGSDNTVDTGAVRDLGTGEDLHVVVVVKEAMTDSSSDSTLTVALEGDSTSTITPDGTQDLFTIPALAAIGDTFISKLDPAASPLQYQYLRLKYTPNNGNLTTGKFSAYLVKDIQRWKPYAKNYTITG